VRENVKARRLVTGAAVLALFLAGCGGETIESDTESASGSGDCGTVNLAVNPWVGYQADSAVVAYVAEKELGCTVNKKDLTEEVSWQGFASGEIDAILEDWGHPELEQEYVDEQGVAEKVGSTGNIGQIGWFVPPWLAEEHPDITNWENLNKYASEFKTSESGDKGQLLDGDPSYVTNDEALVENLDLDFKVVYAGSETALITAFRQAEEKKEFMIGYFYTPQWFLSEVPLVKVDLPEYTEGCDSDPEKVACDYPETDLQKFARTEFMDSGSPAATLIQNFNWTNDDQNEVAKYIAEDKMSDDEAAQKWVEANQDKVDAWLAS